MIIVTGTIAYDYIMDFPGLFKDHILKDQLHQINLSFIVNNFAKRRGGTAGNVSYSLGLLHVPHTLFSVAGSDFDEYKKAFEKLGVDVSHVQIDPSQHCSTGFAMTDKSDNQIWGYFYGASEKIKDLALSTVAKKGDIVLIGPSGSAGSMSLLNQCIEQKIDYMFDPGFILTQVSDEDLLRGIENATYIIGNDYEINVIKKRVKDWNDFFSKKIIITTQGEKGATIEERGQTHEIKSCPPAQVVDPTGAGDAWRSGFLAGLTKNLDLQICGQIGAVAASYAIEKYGTQEHTYTKEEFLNRYRQTYGTVIEL